RNRPGTVKAHTPAARFVEYRIPPTLRAPRFPMPKLRPDTVLPPLTLRTLAGETLAVPSGGPEFLHLQFRRFAGCPVCNTHLRSFSRRATDLEAAGVREIVFFHSSASELEKHQADLPFTT